MQATPPRFDARIVTLCHSLKGQGYLTYAEQAAELNRRGRQTSSGAQWTAQSVYLCCRRQRQRHNGKRISNAETRELLDGRWRTDIRRKVLELRTYGVTRYDDVAKTLNDEGIPTRTGKFWSRQSVYRLMRQIGLQTGNTGRRRRDE